MRRVEETDWVPNRGVVHELLRFADTLIVRLNRAVPVGEADGAPAALAALGQVRLTRRTAARSGRRVTSIRRTAISTSLPAVCQRSNPG
jgi:predicted RNA polymerase sigma factor